MVSVGVERLGPHMLEVLGGRGGWGKGRMGGSLEEEECGMKDME